MSAFHATTHDFGATTTFTNGGYYERVSLPDGPADPSDDPVPGTLTRRVGAGFFCGFEKSRTPELAASKTPAGALFAQAYNQLCALGTAPTRDAPDITVYLYECERPPDIDLSAATGDFGVTQEVRYRHLDDAPVQATRDATVEVPSDALADLQLAYLPDGPHIITEWATAVRDALSEYYETETYPDPTDRDDIRRPDLAAYPAAAPTAGTTDAPPQDS